MKPPHISILAQAMMAISTGSIQVQKRIPPKTKKDPTQKIPKGLKKYTFGENHVYALNQKNANKKAIKLGFKTN